MAQRILQADLVDKSKVGTDAQYADLLDQINSIRDTASMDNTNPRCWRSNHQYTNFEWLLDTISELVDQSLQTYSNDKVFSDYVVSRKYKIFYWTNINQPGSRNVMHSHSNACLSGVYYVQGTGTGELRMINPANMLGTCNEKSPFTRDFIFNPSDRDLIMWPSWMPHEVEPNLSNKERINIAFDITFY